MRPITTSASREFSKHISNAKLAAQRGPVFIADLLVIAEPDAACGCDCLPVDATVARCSAALQMPDPIPYRDSLIAATALVHRMVLVTRNTADFNRTGLTLMNPWSTQLASAD